jgi:Glycosyltransferases, probably involved in cell wall biogenesis
MQHDILKNPVDFSVLIPAYNEETNITATIGETVKVLEAFNPSYEIIVIDDGSRDKTCQKVADIISSGNIKVKIQSYFPNKGKGYALKYGTNFTNGNYILFLDADLDLHPSHLVEMFKIMQENRADAVIGSKMHKGSIINYPILRKILSSLYYLIIKVLFRLKVKDTQTGIKLFKQDVLKNCISQVLVKRYAFDLELLVIINRKGYKIFEAPVHVKENREFRRIGIKDAFKVFFDTLGVFGRYYFKKQYN